MSIRKFEELGVFYVGVVWRTLRRDLKTLANTVGLGRVRGNEYRLKTEGPTLIHKKSKRTGWIIYEMTAATTGRQS